MKDPSSIIIRPLLTEKSVRGAEQGKYSFRVRRDANKIEIGQAIERLFPGVRVEKVNTMTVRGKRRRMSGYRSSRGARKEGRTVDWKKAIVSLKSGQIPLFEGR